MKRISPEKRICIRHYILMNWGDSMFLESITAAFILTFLGMLFLIGELLVKMRGLAGLLGMGFIALYFSAHLSNTSFFLMITLFLVALSLIVIDGKILNDGTLSFIGVGLMILAIGLSAPNWVNGLYAVTGIILGMLSSFLFLKVFPKRKMWDKVTLLDRLTSESGYNSMNKQYQSLINKNGVALTDLRPSGTVRVDDQDYSAVANGKWIEKGSEITVTYVDGTKIVVEEVIDNLTPNS
ncbi:NfeD-like partner-binding protein [Melghiribacillus thermohalophilus]|uniref:NfeD-like partner-binding protein n=2 Tax=Melghiribacillus thermohalophilus TaxID=1324956 RepID=A0A4R3NBJ5_9BACI|nr:NfeD-like partner-binding protein [Melghiribacillus thermohalophilus]